MNELHGGNIYRNNECTDFSANINPMGMPEHVRFQVIRNAELWEHYPDPECLMLRFSLAKREGVTPAQVVCGNGADDLVWRIVQTLHPKNALLAVPTFTEYARALGAVGCDVKYYALSPENVFLLDDTFLTWLHPETDMVILCNPNNPTGRLISPLLLAEICRKCEENATYLLVDECFLDLVESGEAFSAKQFLSPHVIVLNAFTKTYAIPGLRLGFAIFHDEALAERIREEGQFWSVSTPAQVAGMAAVDENEYLKKSRKLIQEERAFLTRELKRLGLRVFPSDANFILFQARPGLRRRLIEEHILIRCCDNFEGLDGTYYRIAVQARLENGQLIRALGRNL